MSMNPSPHVYINVVFTDVYGVTHYVEKPRDYSGFPSSTACHEGLARGGILQRARERPGRLRLVPSQQALLESRYTVVDCVVCIASGMAAYAEPTWSSSPWLH